MTPEVTPVCLGVMCSQHCRCERYRAVDFAPINAVRIYFCPDHSALFVPIRAELPPSFLGV